jgi:hypothetical protein
MVDLTVYIIIDTITSIIDTYPITSIIVYATPWFIIGVGIGLGIVHFLRR